jgi:hypothetical protein
MRGAGTAYRGAENKVRAKKRFHVGNVGSSGTGTKQRGRHMDRHVWVGPLSRDRFQAAGRLGGTGGSGPFGSHLDLPSRSIAAANQTPSRNALSRRYVVLEPICSIFFSLSQACFPSSSFACGFCSVHSPRPTTRRPSHRRFPAFPKRLPAANRQGKVPTRLDNRSSDHKPHPSTDRFFFHLNLLQSSIRSGGLEATSLILAVHHPRLGNPFANSGSSARAPESRECLKIALSYNEGLSADIEPSILLPLHPPYLHHLSTITAPSQRTFEPGKRKPNPGKKIAEFLQTWAPSRGIAQCTASRSR